MSLGRASYTASIRIQGGRKRAILTNFVIIIPNLLLKTGNTFDTVVMREIARADTLGYNFAVDQIFRAIKALTGFFFPMGIFRARHTLSFRIQRC